jgi:two-component system chemotaxis response regulator CheY
MSLRDKLRVMVVDDTSVSRALIVQAVEQMGVRHVQHTSDGKKALDALTRNPAHLVISDQNMPGMSGLELLHAMRSGTGTAKMAFILVTGRPDKDLITQGKKLGMNNFLPKPFTPADMKKCIEAVVGPV